MNIARLEGREPPRGKWIPHEYVDSVLGHGEAMCAWCLGTNRENAIISPNHCASRAEKDKSLRQEVAKSMLPNTIAVRNVNDALSMLRNLLSKPSDWRKVSPRGMATLEWRGPFLTEYAAPNEYVLFDPVRDANPFFHFMESIWILAGNADVATLAKYNSQMSQFSDDGKVFHAPYGYRLRHHFTKIDIDKNVESGAVHHDSIDQILGVIDLLLKEPDTRRAVMCLWDPAADLSVAGWDRSNMDSNVRDIPCNDLVFFKLRDGILDMTVCCRSNDAILGAYGANAVQFGVLLEFIAGAVGARIGTYTQLSDSFHVYVDSPQYKRLVTGFSGSPLKQYPFTYGDGVPHKTSEPSLFKLASGAKLNYDPSGTEFAKIWLYEAELFMAGERRPFFYDFEFFHTIAIPIAKAWDTYKETEKLADKNSRIAMARTILERCTATDWAFACSQWLARREEDV